MTTVGGGLFLALFLLCGCDGLRSAESAADGGTIGSAQASNEEGRDGDLTTTGGASATPHDGGSSARGGSGGDASGRDPGSSADTMNGGTAAQAGTSSGGGPGEAGGAATGGNDSDSGMSNDAGSGGSNTTGGNNNGLPWCPDFETCRRGADQGLAPGEACPPGRECYVDEWCGTDVECVKFVDDGCTDRPACDQGQLSSPVCSGVGICEIRSLCGQAVACETPLGEACWSRDRVFAATLPSACAALSIRCPEGSSPFSDECGCGCEQPGDCPEGVNCQPGSEGLSPLCGSADCPFTPRVF